MSSRAESYVKDLMAHLQRQCKTVPIEPSEIYEPQTLAVQFSFAVPNSVTLINTSSEDEECC